MVNVNLTGSQVSRVAVIGANGASKSTAFKALVGEQLSTSGSFWKAAGLRLASWLSTPSTTRRSTCRRRRRSTSCGALRVTTAVDEESARSVECIVGVTGSYAPALTRRGRRRRRRRTRLVPWFRRPRWTAGRRKRRRPSVRGEVAVQTHRGQRWVEEVF